MFGNVGARKFAGALATNPALTTLLLSSEGAIFTALSWVMWCDVM